MCSMNTRKSTFFSQTSVRIQLYKQLGYNTCLKLLRLPLLGGQPSRLTKFFVEYYRFVKNCRNFTNNLDTKHISSY